MISGKRWMRWAAASVAPVAVAVAGAISCVGSEPVVGGTGGAKGTGGSGAGGGVTSDASTCPLTLCGAACTDTKVDPANCGTCGHACDPGNVCVASACAVSCPPQQSLCGTACADTMVDPANCGSCGHACDPGAVCSAGTCTTSCPPQQSLCGTACADTMVDPANCGTCGHACDPGDVCAAGACALTCPSTLTLCGGTVCVDTATSNAHCGACATACAAGQTCVAGQCSLVCGVGLLLCADPGAADAGTSDAGAPQLCADPMTDARNCGGCGKTCAPDQFCTGGTCGYAISCADLLARTGPIADGTYEIQPVGKKAFAVYCAGMMTATPKEYLTLLHTYGNGAALTNYASYDKSNACNCTDNAYRYFEKVRLNPATLVVDVTDATFAANVSGDPNCWAAGTGICKTGDTLSYAFSGNCILNGGPAPGNVELHGLPFSLDPSVVWVPNGFDPYGTSTISADRKTANFTGGGDCGGTNPTGPLLLKQD